MIALYPGSFDPITYGHKDIIDRCLKKFDKVIVAVLNNKNKNLLFTSEERVELINTLYKDCDKIIVESFDGLLVDYAKQTQADVIVRGLRAVTDFEYEMQMSMFNKVLYPDIETLFMVTGDKYSFLSSSLVKEVASYKGDISSFVPKEVENKLKEKF